MKLMGSGRSITGGSSGIGLAIAEAMLAKGAKSSSAAAGRTS